MSKIPSCHPFSQEKKDDVEISGVGEGDVDLVDAATHAGKFEIECMVDGDGKAEGAGTVELAV